MQVRHFQQVALQPVQMPGASGCQVRWLIGTAEGAPNFAMRQFEVAAGGYTPRHRHPYEHEVFVLEGEGEVLEEHAARSLRAGDVVFIPADEIHQFRNQGASPFRFLCLIPQSAASQPVTVVPECGAAPR